MKLGIFPSWSCSDDNQKKDTEKRAARAEVLSLSFSSPPRHLKVPISNPGRGGGGRYTDVKGMVCKQCGLG